MQLPGSYLLGYIRKYTVKKKKAEYTLLWLLLIIAKIKVVESRGEP